MVSISGSVGRNGMNRLQDVRLIQELLNRHKQPTAQPLKVDGLVGPRTIAAIEDFQRRVVGMLRPDGRVDAGGRTLAALTAGSSTPGTPVDARLSGATWWHAHQAKYPNSTSVTDLETGFRTNVEAFLGALRNAGANVTISSTRRSKQRAYLMHYSWKIAKGQIKASEVPAEPGVEIIWDHGNEVKSKQAAQQMVDLFRLAHIASLTSRHIEGKAIDMTITWTGTLKIKNKSGQTIEITGVSNGASNTTLHFVGAGYGVKKLVTDPPHWSSDGR